MDCIAAVYNSTAIKVTITQHSIKGGDGKPLREWLPHTHCVCSGIIAHMQQIRADLAGAHPVGAPPPNQPVLKCCPVNVDPTMAAGTVRVQITRPDGYNGPDTISTTWRVSGTSEGDGAGFASDND